MSGIRCLQTSTVWVVMTHAGKGKEAYLCQNFMNSREKKKDAFVFCSNCIRHNV